MPGWVASAQPFAGLRVEDVLGAERRLGDHGVEADSSDLSHSTAAT